MPTLRPIFIYIREPNWLAIFCLFCIAWVLIFRWDNFSQCSANETRLINKYEHTHIQIFLQTRKNTKRRNIIHYLPLCFVVTWQEFFTHNLNLQKMQSHAICSCLNTKFPSHDLNSILRREVGYIRQVEYAFMENVS